MAPARERLRRSGLLMPTSQPNSRTSWRRIFGPSRTGGRMRRRSPADREPVPEQVDVAVIGSGYCGLSRGARARPRRRAHRGAGCRRARQRRQHPQRRHGRRRGQARLAGSCPAPRQGARRRPARGLFGLLRASGRPDRAREARCRLSSAAAGCWWPATRAISASCGTRCAPRRAGGRCGAHRRARRAARTRSARIATSAAC